MAENNNNNKFSPNDIQNTLTKLEELMDRISLAKDKLKVIKDKYDAKESELKAKKEAEQAAAYDACIKIGVING